MAEHVTSYIDKRERQMEKPVEERPVITLTDLLYLVKAAGGSNRDGIFTVEELAAFLAAEGHLGPLDIRKTLGQASYITKLDGDKLKIEAIGPSGTTGKFFEIAYDDTNHQVLSVKIGDKGSGETSSVELKNGSVTVTKVGRPGAGPLVTEITDEGSIRIRSYGQDGTTVVKQVTMNLTDGIFNGTKSNVNGLSLPHWLDVGGNLSVAKSLKFAPILTLKMPSGSSEYSVSATLDAPDSYPDGISKSDVDFDGSVVMFVSDSGDSKVLGGLGLFGTASVTVQGGCGVTLVRKTVGTTARWVPFG